MKNLILLSLVTINVLYADMSMEEKKKILEAKLFAKAFKKKSQMQQFYLPLRVNQILQDEVFVKIDNQEHVEITKETAEYISSLLKEEYQKKFDYSMFEEEEFAPLSSLNQFGITSAYNSNDIMLDVKLPAIVKKASLIRFNRGSSLKDVNGSVLPRDYSGGINLYMNQQYSNNGGDGFSVSSTNVSSDVNLNIQDFVIEGRLQYNKDLGGFSRNHFRVVRDDPENQIRYTAGDIILPHHDRMAYQETLGVGVEKFFVIGNGYNQNISRINSHEFFIRNRSRVEVYVNDRFRNALQLDAGTHNLFDLNLPNGLSNVQLRIIEDGGKIEYLNFDDYSYSEVLQKGIVRYGAGVGIESTLNQDGSIAYNKKRKVASAFVEYGLFDSMTVEGGVQGASDNYSAADLELIIGSNWGLINPYIIATKYNETQGYKKGLDYRGNLGQTNINLGYEEVDSSYTTLNTQFIPAKSRLLRANVYTMLPFDVTLGLTASQYKKDEEIENRYGAIFRKNYNEWMMELNMERTNRELQESESLIYASATYRFGTNSAMYTNYVNEGRQLLNARYDAPGQYGLSSELQYEQQNQGSDTYGLRTDFYDEKFRVNSTYNARDKNQQLSMQLATGMVFAGDTATITAPITSSFVIVDNDDELEIPLGLNGYQTSESYVYDRYAVNTSDYSNRELIVDESELDFGVDLKEGQQKFLSFYKTGSVMKIEATSLHSIKGAFFNKETNEPLAFKSFKVFNTQTGKKDRSFTNEQGSFIINEVEEGHYNISFSRERGYKSVARYSFDIKSLKGKEPLIDFGKIFIEMPEKKVVKKYVVFNKQENNKVNNIDTIRFTEKGYGLTAESKHVLDKISKKLKKKKKMKIDIIGYSDGIGTQAYRMELSIQRAKSVEAYLLDKSVNSEQLNVLGMGKKEVDTSLYGEVKLQVH